MGWFSGKKKTYVSSVVYNLAGDEKKRANYLTTSVVSGVLSNNPSLSNHLTQSYIKGPGLKLRSYGRWARTQGYTAALGMSTGTIIAGNSLNNTQLASQIPHPADQDLFVQSSRIGRSDYSYWLDKYLMENRPEMLTIPYEADFNESTGIVTIKRDGFTAFSFALDGYVGGANYIYASYFLVANGTDGPVVIGDEITLPTGDPFPSNTGWVNDHTTSTPQTLPLTTTTTVVSTFSDGRPAETTTSSTTTNQTYNDVESLWARTDYLGIVPPSTQPKSLKRVKGEWTTGAVSSFDVVTTTTETIAGGVTKTNKKTVTTDTFYLVRKYRIDEQEEIHGGQASEAAIFIYRQGSGNAVLDEMFNSNAGIGSFFPYIPIRIDNKFVSDTWQPQIYPWAKRAYKRATDAPLRKTINSISDNDSLGDIDYVYATFGVSLNVRENVCKKYIYKFFKMVMEDGSLSGLTDYNAWKVKWAAALQSYVDWYNWMVAQQNTLDPNFGSPEPTRLTYPDTPGNSIQVSSSTVAAMNYDITVSWNYLTEATGTGLLKPGAKKDELWFNKVSTDTFEQIIDAPYLDTGVTATDSVVIEVIELCWQESLTTWRKLTIGGLKHRNLVYNGKSVDITANEALDDIDESGFIIPLHEQIYRDMGMVEGTQMATACCFLVFNCYKIVKQKWYQTGIFQIIIIIIAIVISMYDGGATAAGVLGSNAAVGAAVGLTGTAALVVGAAINAIAAMIVMMVIQEAATGLFGDKIGALVGAVVAVVAVQMGSAMQTGASASQSFAGLMKADNILKLTAAVGKGYAGYAQAATNEYVQKTTDLLENYEKESKALNDQFYETISNGFVDPSVVTEALQAQLETAEVFLGRTLMTGSDVVEMSQRLVSDFVLLTTSVQLP